MHLGYSRQARSFFFGSSCALPCPEKRKFVQSATSSYDVLHQLFGELIEGR